MSGLLIKLLPLLIIFLIGLFLRYRGIFNQKNGDDFIKLVFFVSLPGLIINSLTKVELNSDFAFLPLISAIIIFTIYFISLLTGKLFKLPKPTLGVFIIGTMILNNGFVIPFVFETFGDEGLARLMIFDFSNGLLTFTFVYFQACKYGNNNTSKKSSYKKFLYSPPIWALFAGILINITGVNMPAVLSDFFKIAGDLTIPLLMLTMGIYFKPKAIRMWPLFTGIFIRTGIGFALGFFLCYIFGLEGLNRTIVLISSAAPIGFNTLTFTSLEKLDREFAASLVSFGILAGVIVIPLLIMILT